MVPLGYDIQLFGSESTEKQRLLEEWYGSKPGKKLNPGENGKVAVPNPVLVAASHEPEEGRYI
jgi:hypothetical protein